jgi:hypothetical protein
MPARPKAARPVGRPSAVEGQHSNRAASAYIAVDTAPSSTPWITDKKRQLQVEKALPRSVRAILASLAHGLAYMYLLD